MLELQGKKFSKSENFTRFFSFSTYRDVFEGDLSKVSLTDILNPWSCEVPGFRSAVEADLINLTTSIVNSIPFHCIPLKLYYPLHFLPNGDDLVTQDSKLDAALNEPDDFTGNHSSCRTFTDCDLANKLIRQALIKRESWRKRQLTTYKLKEETEICHEIEARRFLEPVETIILDSSDSDDAQSATKGPFSNQSPSSVVSPFTIQLEQDDTVSKAHRRTINPSRRKRKTHLSSKKQRRENSKSKQDDLQPPTVPPVSSVEDCEKDTNLVLQDAEEVNDLDIDDKSIEPASEQPKEPSTDTTLSQISQPILKTDTIDIVPSVEDMEDHQPPAKIDEISFETIVVEAQPFYQIVDHEETNSVEDISQNVGLMEIDDVIDFDEQPDPDVIIDLDVVKQDTSIKDQGPVETKEEKEETLPTLKQEQPVPLETIITSLPPSSPLPSSPPPSSPSPSSPSSSSFSPSSPTSSFSPSTSPSPSSPSPSSLSPSSPPPLPSPPKDIPHVINLPPPPRPLDKSQSQNASHFTLKSHELPPPPPPNLAFPSSNTLPQIPDIFTRRHNTEHDIIPFEEDEEKDRPQPTSTPVHTESQNDIASPTKMTTPLTRRQKQAWAHDYPSLSALRSAPPFQTQHLSPSRSKISVPPLFSSQQSQITPTKIPSTLSALQPTHPVLSPTLSPLPQTPPSLSPTQHSLPPFPDHLRPSALSLEQSPHSRQVTPTFSKHTPVTLPKYSPLDPSTNKYPPPLAHFRIDPHQLGPYQFIPVDPPRHPVPKLLPTSPPRDEPSMDARILKDEHSDTHSSLLHPVVSRRLNRKRRSTHSQQKQTISQPTATTKPILSRSSSSESESSMPTFPPTPSLDEDSLLIEPGGHSDDDTDPDIVHRRILLTRDSPWMDRLREGSVPFHEYIEFYRIEFALKRNFTPG
ncbi:hypothetical protein BLNAU_25 [Blattamonas nauphoetae]|uniref:Uncharacterized protein n=1 Tax=Blattamonas nauphoetae TaxID=2049346 RepID=A0ABQ9YLU1_9EUKA|nr:hypothetical protein BLNAU_25 [Blattamonas nauphoetae]